MPFSRYALYNKLNKILDNTLKKINYITHLRYVIFIIDIVHSYWLVTSSLVLSVCPMSNLMHWLCFYNTFYFIFQTNILLLPCIGILTLILFFNFFLKKMIKVYKLILIKVLCTMPIL